MLRTFESGKEPQLVDLGSCNGTFVNGVRLKAHSPVTLKHGDMLRIGLVKWTFSFELPRNRPKRPPKAEVFVPSRADKEGPKESPKVREAKPPELIPGTPCGYAPPYGGAYGTPGGVNVLPMPFPVMQPMQPMPPMYPPQPPMPPWPHERRERGETEAREREDRDSEWKQELLQKLWQLESNIARLADANQEICQAIRRSESERVQTPPEHRAPEVRDVPDVYEQEISKAVTALTSAAERLSLNAEILDKENQAAYFEIHSNFTLFVRCRLFCFFCLFYCLIALWICFVYSKSTDSPTWVCEVQSIQNKTNNVWSCWHSLHTSVKEVQEREWIIDGQEDIPAVSHMLSNASQEPPAIEDVPMPPPWWLSHENLNPFSVFAVFAFDCHLTFLCGFLLNAFHSVQVCSNRWPLTRRPFTGRPQCFDHWNATELVPICDGCCSGFSRGWECKRLVPAIISFLLQAPHVWSLVVEIICIFHYFSWFFPFPITVALTVSHLMIVFFGWYNATSLPAFGSGRCPNPRRELLEKRLQCWQPSCQVLRHWKS